MTRCPFCTEVLEDDAVAGHDCRRRGRVVGRIYPGPAGTRLVVDDEDGLTITIAGTAQQTAKDEEPE